MLALVGCGASKSTTTSSLEASSATCPALAPSPDLPPGTSNEHRRLDYWLSTLRSQVSLETPLLDAAELRALARSNEQGGHRFDPTSRIDREFEQLVTTRETKQRSLAALRQLYDESGRVLDPAELGEAARFERDRATTHRANGPLSLRCTPRESSFFHSETDHRFDRNQCSLVERGELVQRVGTTPDGQTLLRSGYTFGYVRDPEVGPALSIEEARVEADPPPFTRARILERAFRDLDRHYGWGGQDGGLDCSSFVLGVLANFGLPVPRFSGDQADAGNSRVDVPSNATDEQRIALLDAANQRGLVLVHFPGHVMLYLGRDAAGTPMAIHSYAEYVESCDARGGSETIRTVDGVDVTTLELGRGTSRRSYLERMTSLTIFGHPDERIASTKAASLTSPRCAPDSSGEIFLSPRRPHVGGEARLIWAGETPPSSTHVVLRSANGERVELVAEQLDGPPYALVARWREPREGIWSASFEVSDHGEGSEDAEACEGFVVASNRGSSLRNVASSHVRPSLELEALWSVFVQKLFDHPVDDRTWPNLHTLLRDPERNLLFDHFTANEEARLWLRPDCADLPFVLRAYFSWKVGIPFAVRSCSRGNATSAPSCAEPISNLDFLPPEDRPSRPIDDFQSFASTVANTVHSASLRTPPSTNRSDLYPLPLTREALRPGTVYADPYGHVLMIVRWIRGTASTPGQLVAADAQPDGTIARPRFWRGTFLFTPESNVVGAGFKAFRPVERRSTGIRQPTNESLRHRSRLPYSTSQYQGDVDAFYDRMEELIDPQALDANVRLVSLVDALQEAAQRRVVSVDVAEAWVSSHPGETIPMPLDVAIFQTEGPWENFSTPSRDMRLLLALDTVLDFPKTVRRRPARFGIAEGEVDAAVRRIEALLAHELRSRSFSYRGSSGERTTLTLEQLVERARAFEVAYNPNDCPEVRWGAPSGSDELSRCTRRAPPEQQRRVEAYRSWFGDRTRPTR